MPDVISYSDLKALLGKSQSLLLIDVRTKEEVGNGHIPGSINIPGVFHSDSCTKGKNIKSYLFNCHRQNTSIWSSVILPVMHIKTKTINVSIPLLFHPKLLFFYCFPLFCPLFPLQLIQSRLSLHWIQQNSRQNTG